MLRGASHVAIAAALVATWIGGSAAAQTTSAQSSEDAAAQQSAAATPGASVAEVNEGGIADIVVTAERRQDTAQRSSLSVQVLAGDALEQVARPQDLNTLTTGVQIGSGGLNPQVYIRGIGDNSTTSRIQNSVTFNIDGVVLPRGSQATTQFFDLARIEILKGPQGTLYGRNASGGVVNLITNRPSFQARTASIGAEVGNFDLVNIDAAVNLPLQSNLALRVAGQVVHRDGYTSDGGQDQKTQAIRGRLLWEPTSSFSLLLGTDYSHVGGQGSGNVVLPARDGNPWRSNTAQPLAFPFVFPTITYRGQTIRPYTRPDDRSGQAEIWGVNAELNVDLGLSTLTILPSHREQDQQYVSFTSNARFSERTKTDNNSVEARLSRESDFVKGVLGIFYYRDDLDTITASSTQNYIATRARELRESKAAFGQATVGPAEGLRGIVGARYTREKITGTTQSGVDLFPIGSFDPVTLAGVPTPITPYDRVFTKFTWRLGVELDVAERSMLYASASTGFKAGGVDAVPGPTSCGIIPFEPEEVTSYVVGTKNRFLDNRLQLNLEGFYLEYDNQQISGLAPSPCGGGAQAFYTVNAGKATNKGVSLDIVWRATANDTIDFSAEYARGRNKDFTFVQQGAGPYAAGLGSLCSATAGTGGAFTVNCAGTPLIRLSKWSGKFRYAHDFNLAEGGQVRPSVSVQAATARWLDIGYGRNGRAPGYAQFDAELAYYAPDRDVTVAAFVRNITNEAVYTSGTSVAPLAPNGGRFYSAAINPPRTYGIRARIDF